MKSRVAWLAAPLLVVPSLLFAQAQGRVKGTVMDGQGKPIPSAKVVITCPEITTYKKEMTADKKGVFTTLIVDATKQYLFHVEAPGFQAIEQLHKPLIGGQTLEVAFTLKSVQQLEQEGMQQALEQPGIKQLREGRDLLDAGRKVEARAKFAEAVSIKPELHLGWLELALLDFESGKNDDAIAEVDKCLVASPNFAACLAAGANAAKAKGDTALFDKYMSAYKTANPSDPAVPYNEAVAYLNKGDDEKAKPLLEEALAADPEYPDALFQLGMVFLRSGDSAKSKELLTKFLEVAPDHREAASAREMLKYL
jgi:tetratricopeptide (TPR) repeat protein